MNIESLLNNLKIKNGRAFSPVLQNGFTEWNLNSEEDQLRFLANCLNETGGFRVFKENLCYTNAERLKLVFPSVFRSKYNPAEYLRNPEKLANLVYDDRKFKKGLGNNAEGDGWKYIGRGAIQLTGKAHYAKLSQFVNIDFVSHPEWLEKDEYKFLPAFYFWKVYSLSKKSSLLATRQIIAGNYSQNPIGYNEVLRWYKLMKRL